MTSPTLPKSRRWRFQFSLRTLMIAVLAYGAFWTLTYTLGASAIATNFAEEYRNHATRIGKRDYFRIESKGAALHVEVSKGEMVPTVIKGEGFAIAPFVILWKWDLQELEGGTLRSVKLSSYHFWIFGHITDSKYFPSVNEREREYLYHDPQIRL